MFFPEEEIKTEPRFRPRLENEPPGSFLCKKFISVGNLTLKKDRSPRFILLNKLKFVLQYLEPKLSCPDRGVEKLAIKQTKVCAP